MLDLPHDAQHRQRVAQFGRCPLECALAAAGLGAIRALRVCTSPVTDVPRNQDRANVVDLRREPLVTSGRGPDRDAGVGAVQQGELLFLASRGDARIKLVAIAKRTDRRR
jgi:hypothetical protein